MDQQPFNSRSRLRAFTLVELLVVIALLGILVGLLMPAIQASRESARKTQCKNNLRQMSIGFLNHESAQGFFPSSGWGNEWVGDPDGGFGATQPGGWAYSILPYMDYTTLFDAGNSLRELELLYDFEDGNNPNDDHFLRLVTTALPLYNCPTKRPAELYPMHQSHGQLANNVPVCWEASGCRVARGDYMVNSGNMRAGDLHGPQLAFNTPRYPTQESGMLQNGISFARSEVRLKEITDGASKTAMVGEKHQDPETYYTGTDPSDNQCVYSGHNSDSNGYTGSCDLTLTDTIAYRPRLDYARSTFKHHFGGAHLEGLHMAYCDGSVHFVDYNVNGRIWYALGGRDEEEKPPKRID